MQKPLLEDLNKPLEDFVTKQMETVAEVSCALLYYHKYFSSQHMQGCKYIANLIEGYMALTARLDHPARSGSYQARTKLVVIEVSTQYMGSVHTVHPLLCHGNRGACLGYILSLTAILPPLSTRNQHTGPHQLLMMPNWCPLPNFLHIP